MASKDESAVDAVQNVASELQKQVDEEHDKGYRGETVDKTPRENYTVAGVLAGKPTPETTVLERQ